MKNRSATLLIRFCLAWTLLLGSLGVAAAAQTTSPPATTPVTDTIYRADGTAASGTVLISWPAFTISTGASVPAGSTSVTLGPGGALNVNLVANAGSTPMGSYYTVVYHLDDGSVTREYWVIPATTQTAHLAGIRSTVLPTSVAMQTVSKSYVDTAIAAAQLGHPLDASTPYVLKTGDTMTGPLVLPGDPVTPLQASDKNYVDEQTAALQAGLGQKVSTNPQGTQQVAQPAGTQLEVNNLNGQLFASQYATGAGTANPNNNGIANAAASPDCTAGCDIVAERTYPSTEQPAPTTWNSGTVAEDHRRGQKTDTYLNPQDPAALNVGQTINLTATESAPVTLARTGAEEIAFVGMHIVENGLTGGNNEYPRNEQGTIPYFKTTYGALLLESTNNTPGQHVQLGQVQNCYGVGDCLAGAKTVKSAGGIRDDADEGTHPSDLDILEDTVVFDGTCTTGCTTGATTLVISATAAAGTQGEGRYLIDTNPAKVITAGTLIGGVRSGRHPQATFANTSFPVSTFLETAQPIPSQAGDIRPGTVTIPIVTTGVPTGFATNTAALPAATGVACVADATTIQQHFETAAYTIVDGSHLQLTLNRPHLTGATVAVGGLCGDGLEQTVDTLNGIRQVFPVIGSTSATTLIYAGGGTAVVGQQGFTSAYANVALVVATIARTGNVVTLTTAGNFGSDLNGLTLTVQGVADSSYNGNYVVTTTGPNTLTYTDNGPDSTTSGGTVTFVTGGYALYPMAEVISVYDAAAKAIDGQMTLAANTVPWAAGDTVEEPHYFQELVYPDTEFIDQSVPRPTALRTAGISYGTNNGPGLVGYLISNTVPATSYFGNGGTHLAPDVGIQVLGVWNHSLTLQAGETSAVHVNCNSHGCNKWNSGYDLFLMDTGVGQDSVGFAPQSSTLNFSLRGTGYQFTPQAFTAGTINVTTLNAGSVHGLFTGTVQASSLPVFGGSGASHSVGAVPDPGATAGNTRFLREDGSWALAGSSNLVASASGYTTTGPSAMPQRAGLLGEYLMTEGSGATVHDTSGAGNDATFGNGFSPTWEGKQDLDFTAGQYLSVPSSLNAAQTWMFLAYFPVEGTQQAPQAPGYLHPFGYPSILCGSTNQQMCLIASLNNRARSYTFEAFNTDDTAAGEMMPPGWHVFTLTCGNASTGARIFYDGAEVGTYAKRGNNTCPVAGTGNYQIGGSPLYQATFFAGKMAGVWAWNTALSPSDATAAAQSALAYLNSKGISRTFRKVTQPAPQILAGLDSRTAGYLLSPSTVWPALMNLTDTSYVRNNVAVSGEEALDTCNEFDLSYASQVGDNSGPVISVIWGGVNDIRSSPQTPRQIANSLHCIVQKAKAVGRVVLATEISSTGGTPTGATADAGKNALDTILRAEAFSWGVDNLADLATDPILGADGASANTTNFFDGLHPTSAGQQHVTTVMQNAVNELLGSTETQRHQNAAATYQELAGDRFLDLTGTSAQTVTLPSCMGYSLPRQVLNLGTAAATIAPVSGETLAGPGSLAAGARATLVPVPGALSTGGCSWERTQ